jgi:hypothetical protein
MKRYIYLELIITAISAIVLISVWSPTIYTRISYGLIVPSALKAAIIVTATLAGFIFLSLFIHKEIQKTDLIITDERLVIKNPYSIKSVIFSHINSVSFVRYPLHHGFLRISSEEQKLSIPLYIENIEEFVQTFATGLVRYGHSEVIDKECISSLKDASKICSSSYLRSRHAFTPLFLASSVLLLFNLIVGNNFWELSFFKLLFWCGSSWILPVIYYIISDQYLNHLVKRAISKNSVLPSSETVYYYVLFYVLLIYFGFGWFFNSAIS